jgi:hypothetical protein
MVKAVPVYKLPDIGGFVTLARYDCCKRSSTGVRNISRKNVALVFAIFMLHSREMGFQVGVHFYSKWVILATFAPENKLNLT